MIATLQFILFAQEYYYAPRGMSYGTLDGVNAVGLILIGIAGLIGMVVQARMQSHMKEYSAESASKTGAQIARAMLDAYGLNDVQITHVKGQLTDHYNPLNRTVNLSDMVYSQATVAANAVAAHECGHAVQHAKAYPWLGLRSRMVPVVNIGTRLGQIVLMVGLILAASGAGATVAWIGLALFGTSTLFALVTLPVEFDASRRALAWLENSGEASYTMHDHARTALRWAAMTYVSAALSSIAMLLYYALRLLAMSSRRR